LATGGALARYAATAATSASLRRSKNHHGMKVMIIVPSGRTPKRMARFQSSAVA
jgi:hypothetical protein